MSLFPPINPLSGPSENRKGLTIGLSVVGLPRCHSGTTGPNWRVANGRETCRQLGPVDRHHEDIALVVFQVFTAVRSSRGNYAAD